MNKTITSILLLISLASKAQVSNQLIASYNFDSNLNNTASSSFNGTATGGPGYTTDRFGVASKSLNLDGVDDKVVFGDLPIHGNFSISMWLNAPSSAVNTTQQSIISKRAACSVGDFFDVRGLFSTNPNSVNIEARNGNYTSATGSGADIAKNEWVHVVYVFDSIGKKTNIYIDGVISTTSTWDSFFKTMSNDASFGIGNSPCVGRPYQGAMDDLRVYYGPLSANAVMTLFKENNYCKPIGGTVSLSENKVLSNYPNGSFVGKITRSKPADDWIFPVDSLDNASFTFRNDSIFTNNLTKNSSTILFKLNTCENKTQKFTITKGVAESFLISKYSFTNNLNDESGNGFNGKYYLGNTLSTASYVDDRIPTSNSAIALNGVNDSYALGDQPWDNANLTISFWLKPLTYPASNSIVFSKRDVCAVSNFIDVRYNSNGVLAAEIRNGNGLAHVSSNTTVLATNQWHHAVIVLDKSKEKSLIYINGVLANTLPWTNFSSLANNAEFKLGASPCSVNGFPAFNGQIDDIRVYSLPIMQSDVSSLYNELVTSINDVELVNKSIYPNPVIDVLNVSEFSQVFDLFGQIVAEGDEKINLSHLNKGIYIVKNATSLTKVIKN